MGGLDAAASSHRENFEDPVAVVTHAVQSLSIDDGDLVDMVISREMLSTFHNGTESMMANEFRNILQLFCSQLDRFEEPGAKLIL